jgi:hypothetical protein
MPGLFDDLIPSTAPAPQSPVTQNAGSFDDLIPASRGAPQRAPLSVRNNNPGNLRAPGSDQGFMQFASAQEGMDAMRGDLRAKITGASPAMRSRLGDQYSPTLRNLISVYAPSSENDTNGYIAFVARQTGLDPDQPLSEADIDRLMPAMIEQEGGQVALQHFTAANEPEKMNIASVQGAFDDLIPQEKPVTSQEDGGSDFMRGLKMGFQSVPETAGATAEAAGYLSGLKEGNVPVTRRAPNEDAIPSRFGGFGEAFKQGEGVSGKIGNIIDQAQETMGQSIAPMIPSVALAAAGGAGGGLLAGPVGAAAGVAAGAFAGSEAQIPGEFFLALEDAAADYNEKNPGVALTYNDIAKQAFLYGTPAAILDALPTGKAVGSIGKELTEDAIKQSAQEIVKKIAANTGKTAAVEGATEEIQGAAKIAAVSDTTEQPFMTPENAAQILEEGAAGLVGGTGLGGGQAVISEGVNAARAALPSKPRVVEGAFDDLIPVAETAKIESEIEPKTIEQKIFNIGKNEIPDAKKAWSEHRDSMNDLSEDQLNDDNFMDEFDKESARLKRIWQVDLPEKRAALKQKISDNILNKDVSEYTKNVEPAIQKVVTPRGDQEIETVFDVVDVRDLVTSDNEKFPQSLQPRDRTRKSSDLQINEIANTLDPARLAESRTTDSGAPIVSMEDNVVESGNGRTMGVRRAYEQNLPSGQKYKESLQARGYDVSKIEQPILIQRRRTTLSPEDRVRFTIASNERTGAAMSSTERAMADAKNLSDDAIAKYRSGDVSNPENRAFLRDFMDSVSPADRGSMMGPDGALSQDGARRTRGALLAKAYEDTDIVQNLMEDTDSDIKGLGNAMTSIAGRVASFRADVRKNQAPKALDITPNFVEAAKIIRDARANNKPMDQVLGQKAMFQDQEINPVTEKIIRSLYDPSLRRPIAAQRIETFLRKYYEEAAKAQGGTNMLGLDEVKPEEILDIAARTVQGPKEADQGGLNLKKAPNLEQEERELKETGEKINKAVKKVQKPGTAEEKPRKRRSGGGRGVAASVMPEPSETQTQDESTDISNKKRRSVGGSGDASISPDKSIRLPPADMGKMFKVGRESLSTLIWRESGIDPEKASAYSEKKRFEIAKSALKKAFGIDVFVGRGGKYRHAVDNMADLYFGMKAMAALNRLPERAMGLDTIRTVPGLPPQEKGLHLVFEKDKNTGRLGWYSPKDHSIHTPGRSNSFAHEWMHGVDYMVLDSFQRNLADDMGRTFRGFSGKVRRAGTEWEPGSVQEAWVNLMNTIFFDDALSAAKIMELEKKRETTKSEKVRATLDAQIKRIKAGNWQGRDYRSPYYKQAKAIPKTGDAGYWTRPTELVARAFESFMAEKLKEAGLPTDFMVMGGKAYEESGPFNQLYPKGEDRERIFNAIERMMDAMVKADMFKTGNTDPASIPLDKRTDPLRMLKEADLRKMPNGIRAMVRKDAAYIRETVENMRGTSAKGIRTNLGRMQPGENRLLKRMIRNPERVAQPDGMTDTRFAQLKKAAHDIANLKDRPLDTQSLLTKMNTARMVAFSSEKTMLHVLEKRNPKTTDLSRIITNTVASPGIRRKGGDNYITRKRETMNKYGNRLGAIMEKYKLGEVRFAKRKAEIKALRHAYFNPDSKSPPAGTVTPQRYKQLQEAAAALNTMNRQLSYELEKSGIDIGEFSDDIYLRRIYDRTKIWRNKKEFLKAAADTYLAKYERDIGTAEDADLAAFIKMAGEIGMGRDERIKELRRRLKDQAPAETETERGVNEPDPEVVQGRGEIDQDLFDEITSQAAKKDAQDWLNNIFASPEYQNVGAPSGFMKKRELPAAADHLLEDFMVSDPVEAMMSLITGVSDQTAWRSLIEPEEGDLRRAEIKAVNEGWDYEDAAAAVEMIRNIGGRTQRAQGIISRGVAATVNSLHLASTALLMARSVFASLYEPGVYYMRTGDLNGYHKVWSNTVKSIINTADAQERRRLFQAFGLIENRLTAQAMAERTGGMYEETPRLSKFANRYFENMLLSPLTRAQREGVMSTIPVWLNVLAQDYKGEAGGLRLQNAKARKESAIDEFVEMGVPRERIPEFVDYVIELDNGLPEMDEAFDPGEMAETYMRAIGYVADHVIQNPSSMDRPRLANSPTGRFVYGLMSFSFAYWDNVIKRMGSTLKREFEREGFSSAARLAAGRYLPAFALHYLMATTVFTLRSALFNWEKFEDRAEEGELLPYLALGGLAYTTPAGPVGDILLNMTTAIKYQKDLANFFVGAQASVPLQMLQTFLTYVINNSPNTDTQERNATEAAYRLLVSLPSSLAVGAMPGGSVAGTLWGIANMFVASKGAEDAVSEAIFGPEDAGGTGGRGGGGRARSSGR